MQILNENEIVENGLSWWALLLEIWENVVFFQHFKFYEFYEFFMGFVGNYFLFTWTCGFPLNLDFKAGILSSIRQISDSFIAQLCKLIALYF